MNFEFRISNFGFSPTRAEEPPSHQDTKEAQSRTPKRPTDHTDEHRCHFLRGLRQLVLSTSSCHPFALQRKDAKAQRHKEAHAKLHRAARSWPPFGGQGPLGWEEHASLLNGGGGRRNRRAYGAAAGGKSDCDGCSHPEQASFSPVGGDLQIAGSSAVNLRHCRITSATTSLHLCASAALRLCVIPSVLLCVSASLWFSSCSSLVSWCLGGSPLPRSRRERV